VPSFGANAGSRISRNRSHVQTNVNESALYTPAFIGVSALIFAAAVALTIVGCTSMSTMGGMPMPGGWTLSMAWMRMPGQTWLAAASEFVGMWVAMMLAMMLPSLLPMLTRYRQVAHASAGTRVDRLTLIAAAGYFTVYAMAGAVAFPVGVALAAVEMRYPVLARAVPMAEGAIVLVAGLIQFTTWKARRLACCRTMPACEMRWRPDAATAWRDGLHLGLQCFACCAGPTAILLVAGVMDLRVMAIVTAAITFERLLPAGGRVARAVGTAFIGSGMLLIVQAAASG